MKLYKISILAVLLITSQIVFSQKITDEKRQYWIGYLTQTKISKPISIWNDFHWVPESFFIARTGLTYHFDNKLKTTTTLGYAHAWFYPSEGNDTYRPEHRIFGQTTFSHKKNSFSFFHRIRYEARFRGVIVDDFLQNEFNFNYRFRYLFQSRYFFTTDKIGNWFAVASDEILFNAGHEIKNNFRLDQNRISLGLGYQTKNMTFQLVYMNQLIESNTEFSFRMNHNLQLLVFHNFDLSKKINPKM